MDDELLDAEAACRFIGGSRPINPATLYRGIRSGIYPKPIKITGTASRWRKSELAAAIERRIGARDSTIATAA